MPGACTTPGIPSDANHLSVFLEQLHVEDDFFENVDMMFHSNITVVLKAMFLQESITVGEVYNRHHE